MNQNNNQNKNTVLLTVVAVVTGIAVFVGIYFLYNSLSKKNSLDLEVGQTLQTRETTIALESEENESTKTEASTESSTSVDYTAPEIVATDADGNPVKLADFKGKTVVLNFWASWCPPCKAEFPDFQRYYDETKDKDEIAFVLVNLVGSNGETEEKAAAFLKDSNYTLPYYLDTKGQSASAYQITNIPTTYIITPAGELFYRQVGILSYEKLVEMTEKAAQ